MTGSQINKETEESVIKESFEEFPKKKLEQIIKKQKSWKKCGLVKKIFRKCQGVSEDIHKNTGENLE